jgi:hypothetical protein
MIKRVLFTRIAMAVIAVVVFVPAVALAGKPVVSGAQQLQLKVSLTPARAGAKGAVLTFEQDYTNPKSPGQQPPYNTKTITVGFPKGLVVHPHAAPQCRESVAMNPKSGPAACPAKSKVGSGTVVVNARPSVPMLITGTITDFNAVDDGGQGGHPKGSPEIILYIKTSVGLNTTDVFHLVKKNGSEILTGTSSPPTKPGTQPGSITIQKLKLRVSGSSAQNPYVTNPPTCHKSWLFSLTTTNYFGQPSVTAHDAVKCTKH